MVFMVRQVQEKCREQNQDLYLAFIDLSKAFTTVNHKLLWELLSRLGVPPKFLKGVCIGGVQATPFNVEVEVQQVCFLIHVIFNMFLTTVTPLSHKSLGDEDGVSIQFHLDGKLFNF